MSCLIASSPAAPNGLSWPPVSQASETGVPLACSARAVVSDSCRGNSVSSWPCTSRVGAVIRAGSGLEAASRARSAGVPAPVCASRPYAWQTRSANRVHGPNGPLAKNTEAYCALNTPPGRKALSRLFQVITGTIASTRRSKVAPISEMPPP